MPRTPTEILHLPMDDNDTGVTTIGGYLIALLAQLWADGESFDGKRPFGNSGWEYDLFVALAKAGEIDGTMDQDGYVEKMDVKAGSVIIAKAIQELWRPIEEQKPYG